jgi:hypothetical protein
MIMLAELAAAEIAKIAFGSSGLCVETRSILIEYPQNSPKSLAR